MTKATPTPVQSPAELELIERRKAKLDAEALWRRRLVETMDDFPVQPFGSRVIVFQRQPEHLSKGGILLPQSQNAPLSGWVVAVPCMPNQVTIDNRFEVPSSNLFLRVGDEVLFPEHASHRISVMVGLDGEEQHEQTFLVIDALDLHGVVRRGYVETLRDVVPGLEKDIHIEGKDLAPDV